MLSDHLFLEQAKPETVDRVCIIVKRQLALSNEKPLTPEIKFSDLGSDSLDTVILIIYNYDFQANFSLWAWANIISSTVSCNGS